MRDDHGAPHDVSCFPAGSALGVSGEDGLGALVAAALDRDRIAQAALFARIYPMLRRYFASRGGAHEADDLAQETLMAIYRTASNYDRSRPFLAWMYSIARRKRIDHHRRSRVVHIEISWDVEDRRNYEEASIAAIDVPRMLGYLPPKQADVIRRTRLDGRSTAEVARAVGISELDVKVSVHRGLNALKARQLPRGLLTSSAGKPAAPDHAAIHADVSALL